MREYPSADAARTRFDEYAQIDPRLVPLWNLCRLAAPAVPANDSDETTNDAFDWDGFDVDLVSADQPSDGWCAEDYFQQIVKPELVRLVGWERRDEPQALRESAAYEDIYSALFHHALVRPCTCCQDLEQAQRHAGDC